MENEKKLSFSICIPVYKGSHLIGDMLRSILSQEDFQNFEIIIGDDNPPELEEEIHKTQSIIESFGDGRIKYFKNEKNLGYAVNLQKIVSRAQNDVLFLMAQDDILARDALRKTHDAFFLDDDVGCVTRPYFWFMDDIKKPVRAVLPFDEKKDSVISIFDGKKEFLKIFESVGQLSGLAYRRDCVEVPFNDECFPAHIYPFAGILRKHKCVFLKDYTVAIGIKDSQTRSVSSIYDLSPTVSWLKMYRSVFAGKEFSRQRKWGEEHILTNYMGLVQLKNYGKPGVLWREIKILIKERPKSLLDFKFWFFAFGTLLMPKFILTRLVDWYKNKINSVSIGKVTFNYDTHILITESKEKKYGGYSNEILEFVSPRKKVLDLGCSTGALAQQLKKKDCEVFGIDYDENSLKKASDHCDKVFRCDLDDLDKFNEVLKGEFFDVITAGDVIEHLKNPELFLINLRQYLRKGGLLITSIPNGAFASVRIKFLLGNLSYDKAGGLLDKDHLRFYSFKTVQEILHDSGYKIRKIYGKSVVRDRYFFLRYLSRLFPRLFSIHIIAVAQKDN